MLAPPALWRTGSQTSSCVFIDLECCVSLRSQDSEEQQPCCEPATYRLAGYNEQMYRAQPSSQDESICTRENHESTQDVWSRLRLGGRCVCVHDAERSAEVGRLRPDPDDPAARHPNPDRHSDRRLRSRSELSGREQHARIEDVRLRLRSCSRHLCAHDDEGPGAVDCGSSWRRDGQKRWRAGAGGPASPGLPYGLDRLPITGQSSPSWIKLLRRVFAPAPCVAVQVPGRLARSSLSDAPQSREHSYPIWVMWSSVVQGKNNSAGKVIWLEFNNE